MSPDDPDKREFGRYLNGLWRKKMLSFDALAFATRRYLRVRCICQCRGNFKRLLAGTDGNSNKKRETSGLGSDSFPHAKRREEGAAMKIMARLSRASNWYLVLLN